MHEPYPAWSLHSLSPPSSLTPWIGLFFDFRALQGREFAKKINDIPNYRFRQGEIMHKFYNSCKLINRNRRMFTVRQFRLNNQSESAGFLMKFDIKAGNNAALIKEQLDRTIQAHPDSMFILTTPTVRLHSEYVSFPYPGHNFVFISNNNGKIQSCMSKRPDTKATLWKRARAGDTRFSASYSPLVWTYETRFTSYNEEITAWEKRALSVSEYPLFVHIIPLNSELGINANSFQDNVYNVLLFRSPYSLHSTIHPSAGHLIPAANCNGAVYESIFGTHDALIQDMYCQEAVMQIIKLFAKDWNLYENLANELGLTNGIESSLIEKEHYRPAFTC